MKELEIFIASLGIGLSLGFMGAGGSILTIPVFVYVLKKDPLSSGVYSMFVVGMSSMAGTIQSMFNKLVDFRVTVTFGVPSIAGVLFARKLILPLIPGQVFSFGSFSLSKNMLFMLCLSCLMIWSSFRMLKPVVKNNSRIDDKEKPAVGLLAIRGVFVGIITGLVGIGGGFLIVPALYFLARLPVKKAIATALLIITFNSLFGFLTSYTSMDLDWLLLLKFSAGAIIGIMIGTTLSQKIPGDYVKKIFGWFILSISFYILYKEFFL
ncbi:MAG TPA: sulfite exporter TauE/SafE family protein [Chitinophagaceae bacterium]|nr:sulfite exporter TauE/SafE family protein [Chitinophagaceae bacterium]